MSSSKGVDDLNLAVNSISLESSEDGGWEEISRKPKKYGRGRPWVQPNPPPKAWGQPDTAHRLGIRSSDASNRNWAVKQGSSQWVQPNPPVKAWGQPDTAHRLGIRSSDASNRNWAVKQGSSQPSEEKAVDEKEEKTHDSEDENGSDDDYLLSDGSDSEEGPQTHESMKNHRMLKKFFENVDALSIQDLNEPERRWHCPACHGGPGAIDWYKGLQPLMTHARTKVSQRVKLHRTFADILDEELRRKGTSVVPAGESYAQWEGLKQEVKDHDIVWPPMVMIMNTRHDTDDYGKWIGMGNPELLDYFKGYAAVRAKHSYGPAGHRGISVLIFESSAVGYEEAERLHTHFQGQGTGRTEWESNRKALFYAGGKRQLYGFLARKDDLEEFNKHCQGKQRLKYEIRSYQEMVVAPMKQMHEDNQALTWYKNKSAKEQRHNKALEQSLNIVAEKLRKTMEENQIVRLRTQEQHEENKEEMDFQENFFKDQIQKIHEATDAKEDEFEKLQQKERKKIEDLETVASHTEDVRRRSEVAAKFKELQNQEIEKYLAEREQLAQMHKEKKIEMKKRHWEEELEREKEFDAALTKLMNKYAPEDGNSADAIA